MMAETPTVVLPALDPAPPSLAPHADTAQALAAASISANTRRTYTAALGRLDTWLAETGVPLSDPILAEYPSEFFEAGKAMVVAAVRRLAAPVIAPQPRLSFRFPIQGRHAP